MANERSQVATWLYCGQGAQLGDPGGDTQPLWTLFSLLSQENMKLAQFNL